MGWIEKKKLLNFEREDILIHGLLMIDGDVFAKYLEQKYGHLAHRIFSAEGAKGQKYPVISFPSGIECSVWETSDALKYGCTVHIYGEMDLPYFDTRDQAWEQANAIAEQVGYLARKRGENQLEVIGHDNDDHFVITYNNAERRIEDIERVKPEHTERAYMRRQPLLDDRSRERLPKLYANEHLGLNALAQVKFFTPSSNWTWYASEASVVMEDGTHKSLIEIDPHDPQVEDVIFFGLVNGNELELGYFSLSELEEVGGGLQLPIERDRHFTPTTLQELQNKHRKERGEI